jgi:hypothetical protein
MPAKKENARIYECWNYLYISSRYLILDMKKTRASTRGKKKESKRPWSDQGGRGRDDGAHQQEEHEKEAKLKLEMRKRA